MHFVHILFGQSYRNILEHFFLFLLNRQINTQNLSIIASRFLKYCTYISNEKANPTHFLLKLQFSYKFTFTFIIKITLFNNIFNSELILMQFSLLESACNYVTSVGNNVDLPLIYFQIVSKIHWKKNILLFNLYTNIFLSIFI